MPKALITGASSGIGLELARIFARERYDLALVARSRGKLGDLAAGLRSSSGRTVDVIAADLSEAAACTDVARQSGPVDVLVNNAGYGIYRPFAESPVADDLNMMHVNMDAVVALTKAFLPGMMAAKSGRIMNVASTAAFQPGPTMALYYASKAFVLHFSEAIAYELRGSGVTVTALCPGPTQTEFQSRAAMKDVRLFNMGMMSARQVAEAGYHGLMAGKTVVIPGLKNKIGALSVRFVPRKTAVAVVDKIQERVH
jgi:short-subunit dehydrogenase